MHRLNASELERAKEIFPFDDLRVIKSCGKCSVADCEFRNDDEDFFDGNECLVRLTYDLIQISNCGDDRICADCSLYRFGGGCDIGYPVAWKRESEKDPFKDPNPPKVYKIKGAI